MQAANIITCNKCGTKNRVPAENRNLTPKCGRCHEPLDSSAPSGKDQILTLRCSQCRAKNRLPKSKLNAGATCGRCHEQLQNKDILSGRSILVTDANFDQTVLHSPLPVLLYAWSPSCSICSTTSAMITQLAAETKGKVRVGKLNTSANPGLAAKYTILSVPSFFIFDAGQLKHHIAGAVDKYHLMMKMAPFLY